MRKDQRILIVDDDKIVRLILSDMLELDGFTNVAQAVNGAEGLALARQYKPDLLLSDMMMPQMDGFQLIQAVRDDETLKDTAIIVLTSREEMKDLVEMTGVSNFIVKPFEKENVLTTIKRVLSAAGFGEPAAQDVRAPTAPPPASADSGKYKAADLQKKGKKDGEKPSAPSSLHEKIQKILKEED